MAGSSKVPRVQTLNVLTRLACLGSQVTKLASLCMLAASCSTSSWSTTCVLQALHCCTACCHA
jgi:hypothetical protein